MKVLIIEDDISTACLLKQLLDTQHKVLIAYTGQDAIHIGLQFEPELIISDWNLKGEIDGITACKRISENCKPIIIVVSGSPVEQLREVTEALSPRHVFTKPLDVENFCTLLEKIEEEYKKAA
jgi:DNA-binding response OmpR family regulator